MIRQFYKILIKTFVTPIFLFQMGKVGSSSLRSTLKAYYPGLVIHAHDYHMLTRQQKFILDWRKRLRLPIYVICPIREPLSRNISAFFQNFKRDTGFEFKDKEWTAEELLNLFLAHYPHNVCLEWFDRHFRTTFGIDVLSKPFPVQQKWGIYTHKSIHILVYRSDLDRSSQLAVISKFIGKPISGWIYSNISSDKEYGPDYKRFMSTIKLPDIYISIMCHSSFCQTFWSKEEIEIIKNRFKG